MERRSAYVSKEARQWAHEFGGPKRLRLLAFAGNLALVLVLLGGPYLRGQARARSAWARFDRFTRCAYGEPPLRRLRSHVVVADAASFATRALNGRAALATQCVEALRAIAPSDDLFLWPSLKRVEASVREAVRVAQLELLALGQPAALGTPLPLRPLRAIIQLRDQLETYSQEAGLLEIPIPAHASAPTKTLLKLPTPGRIPLYAGTDAVLSLWGDDGMLRVTGLDRTGLSYLELSEHVDTAVRLPRPKLLRDLLVVGERVFLVWGMPPARCLPPNRCSGKSTGLAQAALPLIRFPTPRWFASQLVGRPDRALLLGRSDSIVLTAEGRSQTELRSFFRPDLKVDTAETEALPPLMPSDSFPTDLRGQSLLFERDGVPTLLGTLDGESETVLAMQSAGQASSRVAALPRSTAATSAGRAAWLSACHGAETSGFVFGVETSLLLGELTAHGSEVFAPVPLTVSSPIDPTYRSRDRVLRFCVRDGALASVLDAQNRLLTVFCAWGSATCTVQTIAEAIDSYAVLQTEQSLLFAYAGPRETRQIRVRQSDLRGVPQRQEEVPAPCWAPHGGMCGPPSLARLESRIVLAARDETDVVALESPDLGHTWQPLHGAEPSIPHELLVSNVARLGTP